MTHSTATLNEHIAQPVLFIPHGAGPCFFMDWTPADAWDGMAAFLGGNSGVVAVSPSCDLADLCALADAGIQRNRGRKT